ncbi:MAG: DUF2851 family protein [Bacteroidota bacterium]
MILKEDFLHYLWKFQLFANKKLITLQNEEIVVLKPGLQNINSGPDFFNAKIIIAEQTWAGNVEVHLKSSDWYLHHHETDVNYDNVILHVVWDHDVEIYRKDNTPIPTLELKKFVSQNLLKNYQSLFSKKTKYILCEDQIGGVDKFTINNWFEKLYLERLENKSIFILNLLDRSNNDWEMVLFQLLAKNFGLKVNNDAFFNLSASFDFSVLRKLQHKLINTEALFFGQAGFLFENIEDTYFQSLLEEYNFLRLKYLLEPISKGQFYFFRLRPANFPTIRLAQLAMLFHLHQNLFSKILDAKSIQDIYELFSVGVSDFWKTHYSFTSTSKRSNKYLTKPFIDLLMINTIIPLLFVYQKEMGKPDFENILELIKEINPEKNSIISRFKRLDVKVINTLETQALLQLKNEYCNKMKCLQCAIGNRLLRS